MLLHDAAHWIVRRPRRMAPRFRASDLVSAPGYSGRRNEQSNGDPGRGREAGRRSSPASGFGTSPRSTRTSARSTRCSTSCRTCSRARLIPGNTDRTFLEPACGHGNFLVEILARKLRYVTPRRYGRGERFEHRILRCLASIYGIDISADNVAEARERMRAVVAEHLAAHWRNRADSGLHEAVDAILATNIIRADTLADAAEIELVAYEPGTDGTFIREWSRPLDPAASEPNLFSLAPRRDEVPVHYSELAGQTEPDRRRPSSSERPHDCHARRTPARPRHPRVPRPALERRGADPAEARERDARPLPAEVWANPDYRWLDPARSPASSCVRSSSASCSTAWSMGARLREAPRAHLPQHGLRLRRSPS